MNCKNRTIEERKDDLYSEHIIKQMKKLIKDNTILFTSIGGQDNISLDGEPSYRTGEIVITYINKPIK